MKIINNQTIDTLKKYFVFDKIFDLQEYDLNDMYRLHADLSKFKKEKYVPNYRFIFLHYDTDYYFDKQYAGLTLINLQTILSNLDISNYFCMILSQQDISHKLNLVQKKLTVDHTAIDACKYQNFLYTNEFFLPLMDQEIKINIEKISKNYLCLNRNARSHRRVLFALLKHHGLLDKGAVSFLSERQPAERDYTATSTPSRQDLCLLTTSTHTRVNDKWFLHDGMINKLVEELPADYCFKNFKEPSFDQKAPPIPINLSLSQEVFLHVIADTVYNYPSSFLNEKTILPIVCKRPFVIVGPRDSIRNLKTLGFKTFDSWWDESYDQIDDNEKRMLAVIELITTVCQKNITWLKSMCDEMKNVLEYNFDFYVNHFKQQQIVGLHEFCKKNLKPRYDQY